MTVSAAMAATHKVLVVGAGAIGLRTAKELQSRGCQVILQAPRHPLHPSTCSMGAGGLWMPYHCDDPRTVRWALETFDELYPMATTTTTTTTTTAEHQDKEKLVEIVPAVYLMREHGGPDVEEMFQVYSNAKNKSNTTEVAKTKGGEKPGYMSLPEWSHDDRLQFQHLTVEMLSWQNLVYRLRLPPEQELKAAGYMHAWLFRPPIVNTTQMLTHLLQDVQSKAIDCNVETGHFYKSVTEMREAAAALGCNAVINCTGLASRDIISTEKGQLIAGRGILLHYDRKSCTRRLAVREGPYGDNQHDAVIMTEEGPWGSESMPCYLIPRGDTILVGGSYLENDLEPRIRDEELVKLLHNASVMGIDVDKVRPIGEWTGFRPYRANVRCEMDASESTQHVRVIHSFGHGGSGWTVNVGAAKEVANLVLNVPR